MRSKGSGRGGANGVTLLGANTVRLAQKFREVYEEANPTAFGHPDAVFVGLATALQGEDVRDFEQLGDLEEGDFCKMHGASAGQKAILRTFGKS